MFSDLPIRKIIHVDMDAFYASVEQMDNPALKGQPIAVGGGKARGVVSAASYEARTFGVRSAMSGTLAAKLCPKLVFVSPRFDRYKEISNKIRTIFFEYSDLVEPLSLDEAYIDVTENKKGIQSASRIAYQIREKIKRYDKKKYEPYKNLLKNFDEKYQRVIEILEKNYNFHKVLEKSIWSLGTLSNMKAMDILFKK